MISTYIRRPDGSLFINKLKRHVREFWITSQPKTITLAPGASIERVPFEVDTQGHFEWIYLMAFATDPEFTIKIFDPGTRRDLMNEEIHANTIAGTAQRPGILVESYLLNTENGARELQFALRNLALIENNIEIVLAGRRWYHRESPPDVQAEIRKHFMMKERTTHYWLTTKGGAFTVPGGATLLAPVSAPQFEADDEADTEVFKITARSTGAFEFRLRERASNRTLMNEFVRVENGWGTAQFPFVFQESLLIERNYDVFLEVRDLSGQDNTIFATLHCRRLWYR